MSAYEKDIKDLIQRMTNQSNMMKPPMTAPKSEANTMIGDQQTDQSPHLFNTNQNLNGPDQSPINPVNSVRPMGPSISQSMRNGTLTKDKPTSVADGACPQCGIIHPPLPPNAKCPMAPIKVKSGDVEKEIDINKFLVDLKNIILSQSEKNKIKDVEKLFKNIIIEVTKFVEGYRE